MTTQAALIIAPRPSRLFAEDEPVIQSQPLLPGAVAPTFGTTDAWDLDGVIDLPSNQAATNKRPRFRGLDELWNLRAREMAMIWFNPRHPALLARGIHLTHHPRSANTVRMRIGHLKALSAWAATNALPVQISRWPAEEMRRYALELDARLATGSVNEHIVVIKTLHQLAPVLTDGGLAADPWPGISARRALGKPIDETLKTPAISPEAWFALVKAAWTYIDVFAPDIFRALDRWNTLKTQARTLLLPEARNLARHWLADPANRVPVHFKRPARAGSDVNFSLLTWMVGLDEDRMPNVFDPGSTPGRSLRTEAERAAAERSQTGVITDLVQIQRPDGSRGSWHTGLHPRALWMEAVALRDACYILTAALSMMRDGELREILKGSVVEYFGSPAVRSTKRKLDPGLPVRHWWIIEPVARAIDMAARLSQHPELAFASVRPASPDELFGSQQAVDDFIRRVNRYRHISGLPEIPDEKITPHMFRRTMAMLTRDFPGSEIAIGIQLKHVARRALANRVSQSYAAPATKWLGYLDSALEHTRFERLRDLFDAYENGEQIGYGPGADRIRQTFETVKTKATELRSTGQARHGDRRVEHDLLRQTRFTIRFGTLNHCTMDESNPAGAKCLESTIVPPGHTGPLPDRCQPSRCGNSILGPEHIPIWQAERGSLKRLLDTPKLPPARKAALNEQLSEVNLMLRKIEP